MKTILIVDDDEDLCCLYERELRYEGYVTRSVTSGPEALGLISENPPVELVILDLKMAPMDGVQVLNQVRKRDVYIPVILYSAHPSYQRDFATWFADAYLTKSSDLRELKEKVEEFLVFEEPMSCPCWGAVEPLYGKQNISRILESAEFRDPQDAEARNSGSNCAKLKDLNRYERS